jgi:hypothetical protein
MMMQHLFLSLAQPAGNRIKKYFLSPNDMRFFTYLFNQILSGMANKPYFCRMNGKNDKI